MADVELSEVISAGVRHYIKNKLHFNLPAKVIDVSKLATEGVVDVLPNISDLQDNGVVLEIPDVLDVPVMFPSAGGGIMSFPIKVGDTVLLCFSDRGIEDWKHSDGAKPTYTPLGTQHNAIVDAIAIPGLYPMENNLGPDPDDVVIKFKGSNITIKESGDIELSTGSDLKATVGGNATLDVTGNVTETVGGDLTSSVTGSTNITSGPLVANVTGVASIESTGALTITAPTINLVGNVVMTGTVLNNSVNVGSTHVHAQGVDGGGDSQSDTGVPQ